MFPVSWLVWAKLVVDRVTETNNSCRSLVEKVFENGHMQDRKGDRRILLTLIVCTTYVFLWGRRDRVQWECWTGRSESLERCLSVPWLSYGLEEQQIGRSVWSPPSFISNGHRALSRGTESARICYNDQDRAIISLKATPFAKAVFFQPVVCVRLLMRTQNAAK